MLVRLLGGDTTPRELRRSLDQSAAELREVAHRVANASTVPLDFEAAFDRAVTDASDGSLESDMVMLADRQLRFEAASQMLQKVYQQIRTSVGGGGR